VPADLEVLDGPVAGEVQLPLHLDGSARATYDLSDSHRRVLLYEVVIVEAGKEEDFAAWLNRDALIEAVGRIALEFKAR
jgi:hypothetical protein